MRFPRTGEMGDFSMSRGPDRNCDRLIAEVAQMKNNNVTEGEANYWFCKGKSLDGENVMEGEVTDVLGLPLLIHNHRIKCREFLAKHKGKNGTQIHL